MNAIPLESKVAKDVEFVEVTSGNEFLKTQLEEASELHATEKEKRRIV